MVKKPPTPKSMRDWLLIGDKRTTGASDKIAKSFDPRSTTINDLVSLLDDNDSGVRMRSFDALEKISNHSKCQFTSKQIDKIFEVGLKLNQQEVLWHWCQIIPRLNLSQAQMEKAFARMNSLRGSKSKIVWTCALQGMFDLAKKQNSFCHQAKKFLTQDLKTGSPAVKARCRLLLNEL